MQGCVVRRVVVHLPVALLDLLRGRCGLDAQLVVEFRLLHHLDAAMPGAVCSVRPPLGCGILAGVLGIRCGGGRIGASYCSELSGRR